MESCKGVGTESCNGEHGVAEVERTEFFRDLQGVSKECLQRLQGVSQGNLQGVSTRPARGLQNEFF